MISSLTMMPELKNTMSHRDNKLFYSFYFSFLIFCKHFPIHSVIVFPSPFHTPLHFIRSVLLTFSFYNVDAKVIVPLLQRRATSPASWAPRGPGCPPRAPTARPPTTSPTETACRPPPPPPPSSTSQPATATTWTPPPPPPPWGPVSPGAPLPR